VTATPIEPAHLAQCQNKARGGVFGTPGGGLKTLVQLSPADWLPLLALPAAPVAVVDADIAAVISGAADKVLRVAADPPYLLHLDFESGHYSARVPARLRLYNTVLDYRHDVLVRSVQVLLHPDADSPQLTGEITRTFPGEAAYALLRYSVLRVWQLPPELLLTGGIGTLALAPVSDVSPAEVPGIIERMDRRLRRRAERAPAPDIWAATYFLLGLRYSREVARVLLRGVLTMKESVTYQAVLEEGEALGALKASQKYLLLVGQGLLGKPDAATVAAVNALTDIKVVEDLLQRLAQVHSWEELLGTPVPRRRSRRRRTNP
jgi:predicted transposase YdaD